jgi:multimeric flavodoxin WrbA
MKVLLVNGSSHKSGTTMKALNEMIKVFDSAGVESEVIQLGGKPIADCLQCNTCQKTGKCCFKDDGVNDFVEKAYKADGFVFGSPTYFAHPSGRLLSFLDRVFYSSCKDEVYGPFQFKPGAAVVTARRGGTSTTYDVINKYFGIAQMPIVTSTYWNNVFGLTADDAVHDDEGLQTVRNLARNMIWMMKASAAARDIGIEPSETESEAVTNFIKRSDNLR